MMALLAAAYFAQCLTSLLALHTHTAEVQVEILALIIMGITEPPTTKLVPLKTALKKSFFNFDV